MLATSLLGCTTPLRRPDDAATGVDAGARDDARPVDSDAGAPDASAGPDGGPDGGPPVAPPTPIEPCAPGRPMACWMAQAASGRCGPTTLAENFGTGMYNVHTFTVPVRAGIDLEIMLRRTGGSWDPALVLHEPAGTTIYDGERGARTADLIVEALDSGRGSDLASVRVSSSTDRVLTGHVTSWAVLDGGLAPRMPMDATYALSLVTDCPPETGLLTPPNFDEGDVVGGYYSLPDSDPAGLYTRKARCSRGNRLLIEALYTVAVRWAELHPEGPRLSFSDLNECDPRLAGDADHATHDDGTHADLSAGCVTRVGCDAAASIDLATLFADTGEVCGIIFDDAAVQAVVNPYFRMTHDYETWHGGPERTFMRTVGGHTSHFHVRVRRPDGTCSPVD